MRVLVYPHAAEIGGSQLNAVDLAGAVRDLGHEVVVVSDAGPLVDSIRGLGLEHLPLPEPRRRPSAAVASMLAGLAETRKLDVVHGYEWPPVLDGVLGPGRRARTAVVGTVMSMSVVPFFPRLVPLMVGTAAIQQAAIAAGHRHVALLEPPVDTVADHPDVDPAGFRERHGLDPDAVLAAMVCRLVPELKLEGLLAACDAVGALAAAGHPVQLVIVGDGRSRPDVEERARLANARSGRAAVVLTGQLDDPRPAYAAADVVIGQGGSALRAMAFGRPVVVVGEEGFSEVLTPVTLPRFLQDGFYGLGPGSRGSGPAALEAGLATLLDAGHVRRELGIFARQTAVARFGLARAAGLVVAEYEYALDASPGGTAVAADTLRSCAGLLAHKVARRVQRLRGTVSTDDANARPVRSGAVSRSHAS